MPETSRSSPADPGARAAPFGALERAFIVATVLLGVVLRAVVLRGDLGSLDSDEAVAGLVTLALLRDHATSTFYWGQAYGGTLEPYSAIPLVVVFGATAIALKLTVVILSGLCALVAWRLARRCIPRFPAACVGLVVWLGPGPYLWWSTKFRGFYWATLLCGLVVLLMTARVVDRSGPARRNWIVMGLAAGLGWWSSPQILFLVLPAALWLTIRRAWSKAGVVLASVTGLIGAAPWLMFNLRTHLGSAKGSPSTSRGVWGNTKLLFREGFTRAFGLDNTLGFVEAAAPFLVVGILIVLAISARRVGRGPHPLALMGIALGAAIWGWFPAHGSIGEGRYVLFLAPFVTLAAMSVATRAVAGGLVALMATSTICWVAYSDDFRILTGNAELPTHYGALIDELERTPDTCVLANYWIAYTVEFESDRRIAVAPTESSRTPEGDEACRALPHRRFVKITGSTVGVPDSVDDGVHVEVGGFTVYG